jgi:hypothetical protein
MVAGNGGARRVRELESFVSWLRGGRTQEECGGRGFRRRVAWCWQVEPLIDQPAIEAARAHGGRHLHRA